MVLLVTTPDSVAIMDTYAATKVMYLKSGNANVRCLVNHATDVQNADEAHRRIARAADRFLGFKLLPAGHLKTEPLIATATGLRRPFLLTSPECPAVRQLEQLARSMLPSFARRDGAAGEQSTRAAA